jgi:hypothetical protein
MKTFNHVTVEIENEEYSDNPRDEFDNLSTFVSPANSRYIMGGKQDIKVDRYEDEESIEDMQKRLIKEGAIVKEFTNNGYDCFAYVEREKILKEWSCNRISPKIRKIVENNLDAEIYTYQSWCDGEVYWYCIKDLNGNVLDSCGGFYGEKYAIEEAEEAAQNYENDIQAEIDLVESRLESVSV